MCIILLYFQARCDHYLWACPRAPTRRRVCSRLPSSGRGSAAHSSRERLWKTSSPKLENEIGAVPKGQAPHRLPDFLRHPTSKKQQAPDRMIRGLLRFRVPGRCALELGRLLSTGSMAHRGATFFVVGVKNTVGSPLGVWREERTPEVIADAELSAAPGHVHRRGAPPCESSDRFLRRSVMRLRLPRSRTVGLAPSIAPKPTDTESRTP